MQKEAFGRNNEGARTTGELPTIAARQRDGVLRQRYLQERPSHVHLLCSLVTGITPLALEKRQKDNRGSKFRIMVSCLSSFKYQCKNIFQTHLRPATVEYSYCLFLMV